mmetsp:Transcript_87276/g.174311  ORF Transcript_87276/g.174311 Transcript_87276/m.174311 type:complete len:131 (-) Transcript_87276:1389-1781(-)
MAHATTGCAGKLEAATAAAAAAAVADPPRSPEVAPCCGAVEAVGLEGVEVVDCGAEAVRRAAGVGCAARWPVRLARGEDEAEVRVEVEAEHGAEAAVEEAGGVSAGADEKSRSETNSESSVCRKAPIAPK